MIASAITCHHAHTCTTILLRWFARRIWPPRPAAYLLVIADDLQVDPAVEPGNAQPGRLDIRQPTGSAGSVYGVESDHSGCLALDQPTGNVGLTHFVDPERITSGPQYRRPRIVSAVIVGDAPQPSQK